MAIQKITSGIIADGAIVATDIADGIVTNAKLAGSITSDKITSVSNTAIAGLIQSAQIGSVSNTSIAGLIQSAQIGSANASVINAGTLAGARLPAGSVLQVVQGNYANITTTTSTSYVDTGLSASITPGATANKVLVIVEASITQVTAGTSARFVIDRSGTKPQDPNYIQSLAVNDGTTLAFAYLDSPSSTSSLTYKIQFKNEGSGFTTIFGNESQSSYTYNTITLMEIAG
jgi:hypothetical protein